MADSKVPKPSPVGRTLALGDYLCIVLFAIIGLQTHGEPMSLAGMIRNALPILVVWWLIAPFLRTYTRPTWQNLLYTWSIAVSTGVCLRFMVLQKAFDISYLIFWGVALVATLGLLLAWRGLALFYFRRKQASV